MEKHTTLSEAEVSPEGGDTPSFRVNYHAKDYQSFLQEMIDHMSLFVPDWKTRNAADLGTALVEVLAYAADNLSYYQDGVATEAYIGTARQRASVKRHAKLVDYDLSEGINSRVWVSIEVTDDGVQLPQGTQLVTKIPLCETVTVSESNLVNADCEVFETMFPVELYKAHNEFKVIEDLNTQSLYGASKIVLKGVGLGLLENQFILIECSSSKSGVLQQYVRISCISEKLGETHVGWSSEDQLSIDFLAVADEAGASCVVRGNVVLADHGRTISGVKLSAVEQAENYRPVLPCNNLTHASQFDMNIPTGQFLRQDIKKAKAQVGLLESDLRLPAHSRGKLTRSWTVCQNLLSSNDTDRVFVVEVNNQGAPTLRFGDGDYGWRVSSNTEFHATYRIGNGSIGNVGPHTIIHVVSDDKRIVKVTNPIAAVGGEDSEDINTAKMNAPQAYRKENRCVTASDYELRVADLLTILQVKVDFSARSSFRKVNIFIERFDRTPFDNHFLRKVEVSLSPFRMMGDQLHVLEPNYVLVDIAIEVIIPETESVNQVHSLLSDRLSEHRYSNSQKGLFYPGEFKFGEALYQTQIEAAAMEIEGVQQLSFENFSNLNGVEVQDGGMVLKVDQIIRLNTPVEINVKNQSAS